MYYPISVTFQQPVIRFLLVECGGSPPFGYCRAVQPQTSIILCSILRHSSNQSFSLKVQQTAQRLLKMGRSRPSSGTRLTHYHKVNSFIHSVLCLTTGSKPPPKRFLHIVRSRASSFKLEYPLLFLRSSSSFLRLLPRLLVTSISPLSFLR